jgi:hypothetical protein
MTRKRTHPIGPQPAGASGHLFPVEALCDRDGLPPPTPTRHKYSADDLAPVQDFYRDTLWAFQLELDGVRWWPGRRRTKPSLVAALADLAELWGLDSPRSRLPRTPTG